MSSGSGSHPHRRSVDDQLLSDAESRLSRRRSSYLRIVSEDPAAPRRHSTSDSNSSGGPPINLPMLRAALKGKATFGVSGSSGSGSSSHGKHLDWTDVKPAPAKVRASGSGSGSSGVGQEGEKQKKAIAAEKKKEKEKEKKQKQKEKKKKTGNPRSRILAKLRSFISCKSAHSTAAEAAERYIPPRRSSAEIDEQVHGEFLYLTHQERESHSRTPWYDSDTSEKEIDYP